MTNPTQIVRRAAVGGSSLLVLLLFAISGAAAAQSVDSDPRWQAWLGCWEPMDAQTAVPDESADAPVVCVIPGSDAAPVEIVTIVDSRIMERDRLTMDEQRPSSREGCTGWESATWSADGRRVFQRSEHSCAGDLERRSTGVMAMLPTGEWLDVRGVSAGGQTGVHVVRYHEVSPPEALPGEARAALEGRALAVEAARVAAAAPLTTADVIEATRSLDHEVVEAWLVEHEQGFALNARKLVELADAGVPERVIDLMVALTYPNVFAINRPDREAELRSGEAAAGPTQRRPGPVIGLGSWGYPGYGYSYYPYGYGYGYGGYGYAGYPVVIVVRGSEDGEASQPRARAVKGRGYTRSGGTNSGASTPASSRPSTSSERSRPSSSRPAASSGSASSGSGKSGSTRTAKPRPNDG